MNQQLPICKNCNDNDEPRALLCRTCSTPEEIHAHRLSWLKFARIGGNPGIVPQARHFNAHSMKIELRQFIAADSKIFCYIDVTAQATPKAFRWHIYAEDHAGEALYLIAKFDQLNGNTLIELRRVIAAIERRPRHDLSSSGRWTARRAIMELDYTNRRSLAEAIRAMPESATLREVLRSIRPAQWKRAPRPLRRALIQAAGKVQEKRNEKHRLETLKNRLELSLNNRKEVSQ